jgi:hypothetical protein
MLSPEGKLNLFKLLMATISRLEICDHTFIANNPYSKQLVCDPEQRIRTQLVNSGYDDNEFTTSIMPSAGLKIGVSGLNSIHVIYNGNMEQETSMRIYQSLIKAFPEELIPGPQLKW